MVRYRALGVPERNNGSNQSNAQNDDDDDSNSVISSISSHVNSNKMTSAFDAAKKVAQKGISKDSLVTEISCTFSLPKQLANSETRFDANDDDTYGTERILLTRRIPILAKFSSNVNGVRYLALQYTPTMVRIVPVEQPSLGTGKNGEGPGGADYSNFDNKHWTIDISFDTNPIPSNPDKLPSFREGSARNLFKAVSRDDGVIPGSTSIIGGGVIWCQRADTLDLIIVTTTVVLVYNMNMSRKQMTKTLVFPHVPAASFWFEPISRTLAIGSYKSNFPDTLRSSEVIISKEDNGDSADASGGGRKTASKFPRAVMEMKTLFFPIDSPVGILPTFAVGTLRESNAQEDGDDPNAAGEGVEEDVVLPTDLSIVNMYGSVYCVELGSLGYGQGIGLTKLDMEGGGIRVRQHVSWYFSFLLYFMRLNVGSSYLTYLIHVQHHYLSTEIQIINRQISPRRVNIRRYN